MRADVVTFTSVMSAASRAHGWKQARRVADASKPAPEALVRNVHQEDINCLGSMCVTSLSFCLCVDICTYVLVSRCIYI